MTLPFEDIRILDFTQLEQGPAGTQVLADFGADVIKIERLDSGELGRKQHPRLNGESIWFMANNRNKRSLSLDLAKPAGREVVYRMVETADVVASNFRPGVMERLGLGYEELAAINPGIIWAVASGYGQSGPYRDRVGQDLLAQAMGGLIAMTGDRERPPVPCGTYIADYLGAMAFAQGIMVALAARQKTGRGQIVDSNLLNIVIASHLQESAAVHNSEQRFERPPPGVGHAHSGPLYAIYECSDGKYFALMGYLIPDGHARVSAALDIDPPLAADAHPADVAATLTAAFRRFTRNEVAARCEEHGLPPGPVYELDEIFDDPQVQHNDMMIAAEHAAYGRVNLVGFPVKLSDTPATLRRPPPVLGEHTGQILSEFGFSDDEIADLRQSQAVGGNPT